MDIAQGCHMWGPGSNVERGIWRLRFFLEGNVGLYCILCGFQILWFESLVVKPIDLLNLKFLVRIRAAAIVTRYVICMMENIKTYISIYQSGHSGKWSNTGVMVRAFACQSWDQRSNPGRVTSWSHRFFVVCGMHLSVIAFWRKELSSLYLFRRPVNREVHGSNLVRNAI